MLIFLLTTNFKKVMLGAFQSTHILTNTHQMSHKRIGRRHLFQTRAVIRNGCKINKIDVPKPTQTNQMYKMTKPQTNRFELQTTLTK